MGAASAAVRALALLAAVNAELGAATAAAVDFSLVIPYTPLMMIETWN